MLQWLNYHHLYYFWVIARENGVTRACRKLRLSQPTLSAQLKNFEQSLGKSLFERKAKKLVLTDTGRLVLSYADAIFKTGQELIENLNQPETKSRIDLRVGVMPTLPKKNIYDILQPALQIKNVCLAVELDSFEKLLQKLNDGHLDVILSNRRVNPEVTGFENFHLETVNVIFVGHRDYRTLKKKFPQSLEGKPLYIPTHQSFLRDAVDQYLKKYAVNPVIRGEIQDSELLRVLAVSGEGIVTIEQSAVSDLLKSKELVLLGDLGAVQENFYLIAKEHAPLSMPVKEILKRGM